MNVEQYDTFFREYYPYIKSVVYRSGIAHQEVEDVASDILLHIVEQDGLGKFEPEKNVKIKTYVTSYVLIVTNRHRANIAQYERHIGLVGEPSHLGMLKTVNPYRHRDSKSYDYLQENLDGDALTFLEYAQESPNYTVARKCLSDLGWEKRRITTAVKAVRAASRQFEGVS